MGEHMSSKWSLVLGRTTYQRFADFWPGPPGNSFTKTLNEVTKYVASHALKEAPPWQNSILLTGDAVAAICLVVFGSGVLVRSLIAHGLSDELVLMIHPVLLGSGRCLLSESGAQRSNLELFQSSATSLGVILSVYGLAQT
jgi:dihydrofolate reductase